MARRQGYRKRQSNALRVTVRVSWFSRDTDLLWCSGSPVREATDVKLHPGRLPQVFQPCVGR